MIAVPVACVVDASVGIKMVVTEVLSAEAHALFAHLARDPAARFAVPELFDIECANILWKLVQRAALPPADAQQHLADLLALRLQRLSVTSLTADALRIATGHGITAYDACYVAASEHLGVPLVTADTRLVNRLAGTPFAVLDLAGLSIPPPPP
jgi:predicted nucleic acid-binding protein